MPRYPEGSRIIHLTQGQVAIVDAEDYEFLMQWTWFTNKKPDRTDSQGRPYAHACTVIHVEGKPRKIAMHRLLMGLAHGDKRVVDHINGNPLDDRRCNLQVVSNQDNIRKSKMSKANSSGYRGVSWYKVRGLWEVRIRVNEKNLYLGRYECIEDAALAYNEAALLYYGDFAVLNAVPTRRSYSDAV